MKDRTFTQTAEYFVRRAAVAKTQRRRKHLEAIAEVYRDKARLNAEPAAAASARAPVFARRERVAAMFRAFQRSDELPKTQARAGK